MLLVAFMLFLDLGVFHKTDHVIGFKESAIWTAVWIGVSRHYRQRRTAVLLRQILLWKTASRHRHEQLFRG